METLNDILLQFGISPEGVRFEHIEQGLINTTYFVCFGEERKYVMQRVNEDVFPNSRALSHNLELVLPHLSDPKYEQVMYHRTSGGELFHRTEGKELWRLMSYLPGSRSYHHTSDTDIAFQAGRILGLFHMQLTKLSPGALKIPLVRFHDLDWRQEQFQTALKIANENDLERTAGIQRTVQEIGQELMNVKNLNLPIRVCHNDTKLNNILFSEEKKALCLIDLDTLMPGFLLYDFGDAVRTLANPAPEEETELSKIGFSIDMFAAFVRWDGDTPICVFPGRDRVSLSGFCIYAFSPWLEGLYGLPPGQCLLSGHLCRSEPRPRPWSSPFCRAGPGTSACNAKNSTGKNALMKGLPDGYLRNREEKSSL